MQLGDFRLRTVSGGQFRSDGGTIFGVVPKGLWSRVFPADENNMIPQAANCVLVETETQKILIDTGYGPKLPKKQRKLISAEEGHPLLKSLSAIGTSAEEIDAVVFSHVHFDHAGGATMFDEAGELVPTFPNAEYIAQRREWVIATANFPELAGAYPQENLRPLEQAGRLRLLDGNAEILPGMRFGVTGGHTAGHAVVVIESGGQTAVYLGDICPSTRHFPSRWCMGYDVDLLETRRQKPDWLGKIADHHWLALFDHDPDHAAAFLDRDQRQDFKIREAFEEL